VAIGSAGANRCEGFSDEIGSGVPHIPQNRCKGAFLCPQDSQIIDSEIVDSEIVDSQIVDSRIADSEIVAGCSEGSAEPWNGTSSASLSTFPQMRLSLSLWDEPGSGVEVFASSRTRSDTAWVRFSGGLVKYTSAHRPM
jgi:hypothetical protein